MKTCLFIIDPQNDFCEKKGSLFVPGADKDIKNLSKFIKRNDRKIDAIFVSLDTHNSYDIAHPDFWVDAEGKKPAPYTVITVEDFKAKKWKPFFSVFNLWAEEYLNGLAKKGRFPLIIWPPHCLTNSWGWQIPAKLMRSLYFWEDYNYKKTVYCKKGENIFTENYSVFEAEYPYPEDKSTFFNASLAKQINSFEKIIIGGEARTHCVLNSVRSLVEHFGDDIIRKLTLLDDTTSDVPIPEAVENADNFFGELEARGMSVRTTKDKL